MKGIVSSVLKVASCVLAGACVALLLLVATYLSPQVAMALGTAPVALAITAALPPQLAFWGVLASPLGGVFRTDFVVVALVLLIAAKLLHRIARAL